MPGRGKGKCLFLKGVSFKGVSFHFHGKSLFLCKRLISTAEAYFLDCEQSLFGQSRLSSAGLERAN